MSGEVTIERILQRLERIEGILEEILEIVKKLAGEPAPGERGLGH